jgi:hypothetical protein
MILPETWMHKWTEDRWYGTLLITAAVAGLVVMMHHPTARSVLTAGDPAAAARMNRFLHGLAIAAMPVQLIGLMGLGRRLRSPLLHRAALTVQAFGLVAGMGAAVASGFVATQLLEGTLAAGPSAQLDQLLRYTGFWNQGLAAVYVAATAVSILLWSVAILRGRGLPQASGAFGLLVGAGVLLWQSIGRQHLGLPQFGAIVLAEAVWLVWVGVAILRVEARP